MASLHHMNSLHIERDTDVVRSRYQKSTACHRDSSNACVTSLASANAGVPFSHAESVNERSDGLCLQPPFQKTFILHSFVVSLISLKNGGILIVTESADTNALQYGGYV